MIKELTDIEKRIINCYAFQHAEENVSTGWWSESVARNYLNLVNAEPDLFRDLLTGGDK